MKIYQTWRSKIVLLPEYKASEYLLFCQNLENTLLTSKRIFKQDETSTVWLSDIEGLPVVVKKNHATTFWKKVKRCLKNSRSWNNLKNAQKLKVLGIPTILPLGIKEDRWGCFNWGNSYLICAYVEGVDALHLLAKGAEPTPEWPFYIHKMIALMYQLKAANISHRDLNPSNWLWAQGEWLLLDLDAMKEHRFRFFGNWYFKRESGRFLENWSEAQGQHLSLMPLICQAVEQPYILPGSLK